MQLPYFSAYKSNRRISRPLIFGWKCVTFCHILHISRPTKLTCIHHKHSTFYWRNQQFFIQFYEERKLFKNSSCSSLNESTLNFCNLLFSSFKKWHFKLEINRGNSLNFNDNTMSVQNEHIARQARFLIKSLTTEFMWPSYKSRSIFCPLFWWPETRLIRWEILYLSFTLMIYCTYIYAPSPPSRQISDQHVTKMLIFLYIFKCQIKYSVNYWKHVKQILM